MHRPALAWTQWRTIGGRARSRALENRLSWHRTSRHRTRGGSRGRSGGACRRGWPQGCLIYRARARLRNDHSRRRRCRLYRCARGGRSGSHGWRLCRRHRGPGRRYRWRRAAGRNWRRRRWRRSRRGRRRGRCRLSRRRRRSSKAGPWGRSRHYKLGRSHRWRSRRLGSWSGRRWRSGLDRGLGRRWRHGRRSFRGRGRLLLADDGL